MPVETRVATSSRTPLLLAVVLLAAGSEIGPEAIELPGGTPSAPATKESAPLGITGLVGRRMEDVERDLILETLGHTLGNRTHAATILGISIRALRNKLRDRIVVQAVLKFLGRPANRLKHKSAALRLRGRS